MCLSRCNLYCIDISTRCRPACPLATNACDILQTLLILPYSALCQLVNINFELGPGIQIRIPAAVESRAFTACDSTPPGLAAGRRANDSQCKLVLHIYLSPLHFFSSVYSFIMNQRKPTTVNGDGDKLIDEKKMHALQQYQDTEGHFSLVRCCPSLLS